MAAAAGSVSVSGSREVRHGVRIRSAEGGRGTDWYLQPQFRRQTAAGFGSGSVARRGEFRVVVVVRCADGGPESDGQLPASLLRHPRVDGFAAPNWRFQLAIGMNETAAAAWPSREAYFRALLEASPDGIVVTDGEGRIVLVNAQTEHLFGYPRDQLIGQPVEVLVPEALQALHVGHRRDRKSVV